MTFSAPLDVPLLQSAVPDWQIDYHPLLDSTNRHATQHAGEYSSLAVVIAETQSAGRGRGKNQWWSSAGDLTFSLVIKPREWNILPREQTLLSLLTAASLRHVLCTEHEISPRQLLLKWPNDLYLCERKLCGILLEQSPVAPECLVIGIGLNVNNSWAEAPAEVRSRGMALCEVRGEAVSRESVLISFLQHFQTLLPAAELRQTLLQTSWQQAHLLHGQLVTLEQSGQYYTGRCEGIDEDGALLLREMYGLRRIHSAVILDWEKG